MVMLSPRFVILSLVIATVGFVNASPANAATTSANAPAVCPTTDVTPDVPATDYQPKLSDNSLKWNQTNEITSESIRPPGSSTTSIFWNGRYKCKSVRSIAESCTKKIPGAVTLGMLMAKDFVMPKNVTACDHSIELWDKASKVYAETTKGKAYSIFGESLLTSLFLTGEFPTLIKNKDVTALVSLDLKTCKEKCYWYCPDTSHADCQVCFFFFFHHAPSGVLMDIFPIDSRVWSYVHFNR